MVDYQQFTRRVWNIFDLVAGTDGRLCHAILVAKTEPHRQVRLSANMNMDATAAPARGPL